MVKVKFQVYQMRKCVRNRRCKGTVHQQHTTRELYQIVEDGEDAIQIAWQRAVAMLESEANNIRPLFQYVIPMRKRKRHVK